MSVLVIPYRPSLIYRHWVYSFVVCTHTTLLAMLKQAFYVSPNTICMDMDILHGSSPRERDLQGGLERETDGAASGELTFFRQSGAFANEDGRAISKGGKREEAGNLSPSL